MKSCFSGEFILFKGFLDTFIGKLEIVLKAKRAETKKPAVSDNKRKAHHKCVLDNRRLCRSDSSNHNKFTFSSSLITIAHFCQQRSLVSQGVGNDCGGSQRVHCALDWNRFKHVRETGLDLNSKGWKMKWQSLGDCKYRQERLSGRVNESLDSKASYELRRANVRRQRRARVQSASAPQGEAACWRGQLLEMPEEISVN